MGTEDLTAFILPGDKCSGDTNSRHEKVIGDTFDNGNYGGAAGLVVWPVVPYSAAWR